MNKLNAITGVYPNLEIDYSKVSLSKGCMIINELIDVQRNGTSLTFTWDPTTNHTGTKPTDRIMVIAYCPEKDFAVYSIDNARRNEGIETLKLPTFRESYELHVYSAFISADKKKYIKQRISWTLLMQL